MTGIGERLIELSDGPLPTEFPVPFWENDGGPAMTVDAVVVRTPEQEHGVLAHVAKHKTEPCIWDGETLQPSGWMLPTKKGPVLFIF